MQKSPARRIFLAIPILCLAVQSAVHADDSQTTTDLSNQIKTLQQQVADLQAKENQNWLTQERSDQIKAIVEGVLADSKKNSQFADGADVGYKNGFFIQSADGRFKLVVTGYMQFRYVFAHDEVPHGDAGYNSKVTPVRGDASEFGFRRARIYFGGNAFDPNLIFMISGDFGNSSSNSGNFQILDAYLGYNFTPAVKVRGGAMLVPFTYAEAYSSGLSFPEFATTAIPFDAVRTLGLSLYGDLIKDTLTYEVQVNDGSKSNALGRPGDTSGALDNRMGYYGRLEWAGNGSLAEMHSESDTRDPSKDRPFVWMLGGAGGYEEQNSQSNAFPHSQSSLVLTGLSTSDSPGFGPSATVNGGLYRATTDFHAKYMGLSFGAAAYLQYLNDELPAGATTDTFRTTYGKNSLAEYGYTVQAAYMFAPQWEVAARFGELLTCGLPNTMEEYTLGLNYYLSGQNAKLQLAETYIPNEAAFSDSGANTQVNSQDLITQVQFQLKF